MKIETQNTTKNIFIRTFGCQMNEYDSLKIAQLMSEKLGFEITENINDADLIVINTCSVREKAQEKLFSELGMLKPLKQAKPNLVVAVGGCVASQEKKHIIKRAPIVNIVFGPQTWQHLPEMYAQYIATHKRSINTEFEFNEKFACLSDLTKIKPEKSSAYVTIMEGCNNFCSYCIVPYTRGREVSRSFKEIMQEVSALASQGVKEINFLGQNVNNYCYHELGQQYTLVNLIQETAKINNIIRIRFTTSHPAYFTDELIKLYAKEEKLVKHLHLPVQSGSDKILKAMRRRYTNAMYRDIITKLRNVVPEMTFASDFIVGFPQESEEDFIATLKLAQDIGFDTSYSFMYSPRPNTLSAKMPDDISLEIKKQRLYKLQEILNQSTDNISQNMLNTLQKVIVTGFSKKDQQQLTGRTSNNRIVNFNANAKLIGTEVTVKITNVLTNSLQGILTETI